MVCLSAARMIVDSAAQMGESTIVLKFHSKFIRSFSFWAKWQAFGEKPKYINLHFTFKNTSLLLTVPCVLVA